jgi:uncharacterized Zn-binding protein involved in type VI secretion
MPGAARTTDATTNHSPCGPGSCAQGSNNVYINNLPAFRVSDMNTPHGVPTGSPVTCVPHTTPLRQGSPNVYVNGRPLGRRGDAFSCGIQVISSSSNVIVNG